MYVYIWQGFFAFYLSFNGLLHLIILLRHHFLRSAAEVADVQMLLMDVTTTSTSHHRLYV